MYTIREYLLSSIDSDGAIYAPDMLDKMREDGCATWDIDEATQAAVYVNLGWHIDAALWQAHLDAAELECHDTVNEPAEQHALLTKWRAALMVACAMVGASPLLALLAAGIVS